MERERKGQFAEQRDLPTSLRLGWLSFRLWLLAGCAFAAAGITAVSMEVQAGCGAWLVAADHWSMSERQAVQLLYRYLAERDPAQLAASRRALDVPLGYRMTRLEMEGPHPDVERVRQMLLTGPNTPREIDPMIRLYRYGGVGTPFLRHAVEAWQSGDRGILKLVAIADELSRTPPDTARAAALRAELSDVQMRIDDDVERFRSVMVGGMRWLRDVVSLLSFVTLLLVVAATGMAVRRIRGHLIAHESRFRAAFHQAVVGMARFDLDGRLLESNAALARILGHAPERLQGATLADLLHPGDLLLLGDGRIDWSRQQRAAELRFLRADGSTIWGRWSASEITAPRTPPYVLAVVEDVSQAHRLASELAHEASHDPLTGLINRREVERRLAALLAQPRPPGTRHALCYVDLDHFKLINDTFGHAEGDRMLCHFVQTVATRLRPDDWFGRMGGDEFAILFPDTAIEQARAVLESVLQALGGPLGDNIGRPLAPGCSLGLVEVDEQLLDVNALMTAADMACYAAKEQGRNRVCCFNVDDADRALRRQHGTWIGAVKQAIADKRLELHAQKILVAADPARLQYEVLPRLRGADGRLHTAGEFLPAIEHYGMGRMLDMHVISRLLPLLADSHEHLAQLDLCHINVSAQSIAQPVFLEFVAEQLDRYPALAGRVCFEITETAVIANVEHAKRFVEAVRARGCKVALDDFGSGLSSFGYLKQFPVDILKIDGAFVRDLRHNAVDRATVRALARLGQELGIAVVAECVEDEQALSELVALGVARLQGFAIHRPCALAVLLAESETPAAA